MAAAIDLETLDPQSSVEMINVNNFEGELYRTSVRGLLTGSERSRSSSGAGSRKSGKIDTDQAAVQALSLRSNMERGSEAKNIAAPLSIFLRSKANLYFEMLSWMDAIRRRHGL